MISNTTSQSPDNRPIMRALQDLRTSVDLNTQFRDLIGPVFNTIGKIETDGASIDYLTSSGINAETISAFNAVINGTLTAPNLNIVYKKLNYNLVPTEFATFPLAYLNSGDGSVNPGMILVRAQVDGETATAVVQVTNKALSVLYQDDNASKFLSSFQISHPIFGGVEQSILTCKLLAAANGGQLWAAYYNLTYYDGTLDPWTIGDDTIDRETITVLPGPYGFATNGQFIAGKIYSPQIQSPFINVTDNMDNPGTIEGFKQLLPQMTLLSSGLQAPHRYYIAKFLSAPLSGYITINDASNLYNYIAIANFRSNGERTLEIICNQNVQTDLAIVGAGLEEIYVNGEGPYLCLYIDTGAAAAGKQLYAYFQNAQFGMFTADPDPAVRNIFNQPINLKNVHLIEPFIIQNLGVKGDLLVTGTINVGQDIYASGHIDSVSVNTTVLNTDSITAVSGYISDLHTDTGVINADSANITELETYGFKTTLGTIETYPINDKDISNKLYVDDEIANLENKVNGIYLGIYPTQSQFDSDWADSTIPTPAVIGSYYVIDLMDDTVGHTTEQGQVFWNGGDTRTNADWDVLIDRLFSPDNDTITFNNNVPPQLQVDPTWFSGQISGIMFPRDSAISGIIEDALTKVTSLNGRVPYGVDGADPNEVGPHGNVSLFFGPYITELDYMNAYNNGFPNQSLVLCIFDQTIRYIGSDGQLYIWYVSATNFIPLMEEYDITDQMDGVTQHFDLPIQLIGKLNTNLSVYYGGQRLLQGTNYTLNLGSNPPELDTTFDEAPTSDNNRHLVVVYGEIVISHSGATVTWGQLVGNPTDNLEFNSWWSGISGELQPAADYVEYSPDGSVNLSGNLSVSGILQANEISGFSPIHVLDDINMMGNSIYGVTIASDPTSAVTSGYVDSLYSYLNSNNTAVSGILEAVSGQVGDLQDGEVGAISGIVGAISGIIVDTMVDTVSEQSISGQKTFVDPIFGSPLTLASSGPITLSDGTGASQRLYNVSLPVSNIDAANKIYVDNSFNSVSGVISEFSTRLDSLEEGGLWRGSWNTYADLILAYPGLDVSATSWIANDFIYVLSDPNYGGVTTSYIVVVNGAVKTLMFRKEEASGAGNIPTATNTVLGVVKGSTDIDKSSVNINGEIVNNSYSTLQNISNNYVNLTTNQSISGIKTFNQGVNLNIIRSATPAPLSIYPDNGNSLIYINTPNGGSTIIRGMSNPIQTGDAANKQYVDTTVTSSINAAFANKNVVSVFTRSQLNTQSDNMNFSFNPVNTWTASDFILSQNQTCSVYFNYPGLIKLTVINGYLVSPGSCDIIRSENTINIYSYNNNLNTWSSEILFAHNSNTNAIIIKNLYSDYLIIRLEGKTMNVV